MCVREGDAVCLPMVGEDGHSLLRSGPCQSHHPSLTSAETDRPKGAEGNATSSPDKGSHKSGNLMLNACFSWQESGSNYAMMLVASPGPYRRILPRIDDLSLTSRCPDKSSGSNFLWYQGATPVDQLSAIVEEDLLPQVLVLASSSDVFLVEK